MSNKQDNAFSTFYESVRNNKLLTQDTTLMLHLAAAISVGCVS
ncbi:MAG: hypothetical protein OEV79_05260 [candidate division WOR-3 bacterium]|nr:hypothetical protein [candidate division WOR-3 bacterium]